MLNNASASLKAGVDSLRACVARRCGLGVCERRKAVLYSGVGEESVFVEERMLECEGERYRRGIGDVGDKIGITRIWAFNFEKSFNESSSRKF